MKIVPKRNQRIKRRKIDRSFKKNWTRITLCLIVTPKEFNLSQMLEKTSRENFLFVLDNEFEEN